MKQTLVVLGLIILALRSPAALAQPSPKIKVGLAVEFGNKDIEAEATSYLSRELRGLGDVEIVTSGAEVIVSVVGAGEDTLALSTVVERPYHGDWFQKLGIEIELQRGKILKDGQEIREDVWKSAKRFVGESDLLGQFVNLTTRRGLKDACVSLVAHIDTVALSKQRARVADFRKQVTAK
jgi:hypothetical protein